MKTTTKLLLLILVMIGLSSCNNMVESSFAAGGSPLAAEPALQAINVTEQVKNGDFSNVMVNDDQELDRLQADYRGLNEYYELVECDLNEDGLKGLVFQEKENKYHEKMKRIESIVAIRDNSRGSGIF